MAAPRTAGRFLRQASTQSRVLSSISQSAPWRCPQCSRTFASSKPYRDSSRRQMQTATAYQPSSLPSFLPPQSPRNAGVPETSISEGDVNASEQQLSSQSGTSPGISAFSHAKAAVTEAEAQKTKPAVTAAISSTSTSTSSRPRRSKLRPRKAAISLTPAAVEQLQQLLDQPDPKLIRVGVKNRGCSGLAYHLEYVDKPGAFDEAVEQDGVKVLVDSKALFSILGSEMDWLEDKLSARFVFKNPNITEQCGCGESFSIG